MSAARNEQRRRIAAIADREHQVWMPSSPENLRDKRSLGERIADALLNEGVDIRAEALREAANVAAPYPDECRCGGCGGCISQQIAAKLRHMADGGAA